MKWNLGLCAVVAVLPLSACMPTYQMVSQPLPARVAQAMEVSVVPVQDRQTPFERVKLKVTVKNNSAEAVPFSTTNIKALLNGKEALVMSYEEQRAELRAILNNIRYGYYDVGFWPQAYGSGYGFHSYNMGIQSRFGPRLGFALGYGNSYHASPYRLVIEDSAMDAIDIDLALRELDYIKEHAIKPTLIAPGSQYSGETTIKDKLTAAEMQNVDVVVKLGEETHRFKITAQKVD